MNAVDYLNFSALAYINFSITHKNKSIKTLIEEDGVISKDELSNPELSALVSESNPLRNWVLINFQPNTTSGFAAAAFQNPDTKEIVFAFRGTEPNKSA